AASGRIGPPQRALMRAAQKVILGIEADIDALPTVTPAELAAGFPGAELRQQFVNGMMVMAVADGPPSPEALAKVNGYAKGLAISGPVLADLPLLAEHHMTPFKLDFLRRGPIAHMLKNQLRQKGLFNLAKSVLELRACAKIRRLPRATAPGRSCPKGRWAAG